MARTGTTSICTYNEQQIFVRGSDLCEELIGKVSLIEYLYLHIMGTAPTQAQRAIVEAAIVTMAEHGMTQSAIVSRLTYLGAPESLQGAVAAGILGSGINLSAPWSWWRRFWRKLSPPTIRTKPRRRSWNAIARIARSFPVSASRTTSQTIRARPRSLRSGSGRGVSGKYVAALKLLGRHVDAAMGRHFTINAPAGISALFLEIGIPIRIMRGFIIISRCIGLVGHLAEEQVNPSGRAIWDAAAHAVAFVDPQAA
jgi:citrate synthase